MDIAKDVIIGNNSQIGNNVKICSGTIIGDNVKIYDGAIIGSDPQDLIYKNESKSYTHIGDNVTIREYVTINRGSDRTNKTIIGDDCYIMSYAHISHDTKLGKRVVVVNSTQIGGNTLIDDYAFVGGGTLIHQKTSIGKYVMVGLGSIINKDILPYSKVFGAPAQLKGLNEVGLVRNYDEDKIPHIKNLFDIVKNNIGDLEKINSVESKEIMDFINNSRREILF